MAEDLLPFSDGRIGGMFRFLGQIPRHALGSGTDRRLERNQTHYRKHWRHRHASHRRHKDDPACGRRRGIPDRGRGRDFDLCLRPSRTCHSIGNGLCHQRLSGAVGWDPDISFHWQRACQRSDGGGTAQGPGQPSYRILPGSAGGCADRNIQLQACRGRGRGSIACHPVHPGNPPDLFWRRSTPPAA